MFTEPLKDRLKKESFYLVYYIYSSGKAIPNWGRLWDKFDRKIFELPQSEKITIVNAKRYLELILMKYHEAEGVLRCDIARLFRRDSKFLKPQFQKTDSQKFRYAEIVRKRAHSLGSFFWSLDGMLDLLATMLTFLICVQPDQKFTFDKLKRTLKKNKDGIIKADFKNQHNLKGLASLINHEVDSFKMYDTINIYRNFFSHNARYLQFLWKKKSYMVNLVDTYISLERERKIADAVKKYKNLEKLVELEYVIDKPIDKWTNDIFLQTRQFLSSIFKIIDNSIPIWIKVVEVIND